MSDRSENLLFVSGILIGLGVGLFVVAYWLGLWVGATGL